MIYREWTEEQFRWLHSPDGATHIAKTIDGIFSLLEQMINEIEELKTRLDLLESKTAPIPQEAPAP